MNLKDLLGAGYHDGMTVEEIDTLLSSMKLADLSTGAYVDKNKYDADIRAKDLELQKKSKELTARMTDDEKAQQNAAEKDALIEQLRNEILETNRKNSRSVADSILAKNRDNLGIDAKDEAYSTFISSISSDNLENTKTIATYINKLVTDSYQKGKDAALKNSMGAFSKGVTTSTSGDGSAPQQENIGTMLAKKSAATAVDSDLYFKKD